MHRLRDLADTPADLNQYEVDHIFHSWSVQPAAAPPRVVSAQGVRFALEDGRELLDFSSCFVSHNVGHQHPKVLAGIERQLHQLSSFAPNFSTRPRALLGRMLEAVTPGDLSRSFIALSGTEANEAAIKIAQQFTGRRKIISRYRTYHGGTTASMSASAGDARNWAQTQGGADFIRVPQPYLYRCIFGSQSPAECAERHLAYLKEVIELEGGGNQIAAMILEPITGANGVIVPPDDYLPGLRALLDEYGILLIADEVMTGFGRTGEWFAVNHWGVVPDIMTMAKGLSGAYLPLSAAIVRKHIGDHFKDHFFSHGATYAGHALACTAALEVIPLYEEENLIENARDLGNYLLEGVRALQERHPSIGDVRGKGLFVGLELVKNRQTKEPMVSIGGKLQPGPNPKLEVAKKLNQLGMICMTNNPGSVIALAPPLIATRADIDEGLEKLDTALLEADKFCV